ncbi:DUF2848 domain-containing protein [Paracoccus onubensis]|uniref:DUF2848 domain-containing protein n=1 Tax=Paracoccus onubensis TaxID=1675788 RepID=UPI00272EE926|nr:DUF2848 domain-containing protein [Paracoccus onubensis]MDP0928706.1 DUF2848 domain-containing protein [Paracoccus onubensis]
MRFTLGDTPLDLDLSHLVIAGWTGRDRDAIQHHIEELAEIGVSPPSATPLFYRVSAALLTTASGIQVVGNASSGEVEPLIVQHGERRWLGLGSDHTDRALEAHSVAMSKQVCAKPCATELWAWDDLSDRLEEIRLESWIEEDGAWLPYQQGTLAAILPLAELIEGASLSLLAGEGAVAMMCGTFGAMGGVRPAARFRMAMTDTGTGRQISHEYVTTALPEVA